jgi:zinc protease
MQQLVRYSWPDDYYKTYAGKVRSLKLKDLNNSATKTLQPASLQWLIVGDKALIEKGIRELGIDEIYEVDGDGKIIKKE